jgi:hypothetical protein
VFKKADKKNEKFKEAKTKGKEKRNFLRIIVVYKRSAFGSVSYLVEIVESYAGVES